MNVRPIVASDADAVASIVVEDSEALSGRPSRLGPNDVRDWWSRADLARDSWLFLDDGEPVAAGWLHPYGDKAAFAGVVAQRAKGRGYGSAIVERAEDRARARGLARMHTWVPPEDAAAISLLCERGYDEVRRFYEMAIELAATPPEPVVPEGFALDAFHEEDARAFHDTLEDAFRDHWEWHGTPFDEWWELRRKNDQGLWFVIRAGTEIAAAVRNDAEPLVPGGEALDSTDVRAAAPAEDERQLGQVGGDGQRLGDEGILLHDGRLGIVERKAGRLDHLLAAVAPGARDPDETGRKRPAARVALVARSDRDRGMGAARRAFRAQPAHRS